MEQQPKKEAEPEIDPTAKVVLEGLKYSVRVGQMTDEVAKACYTEYYPDVPYGENVGQ